MTKRVTERQMEIFHALKKVLGRGEKPTYRAIAAEAGCHLSYAHVAIISLTRKGMVNREPGKLGGIQIVET